jgi:Cu/Ag efflux pump CusA
VTVRAEGRIGSAKDLGDVVVERKGSRTPLYVKDLGDIREAPASAMARSPAMAGRTRRSSAS